VCPELGNAVGSNGTRIPSCSENGEGSERACCRVPIPTPRKTERRIDFLVKIHPAFCYALHYYPKHTSKRN
jgi:hypothetical protein